MMVAKHKTIFIEYFNFNRRFVTDGQRLKNVGSVTSPPLLGWYVVGNLNVFDWQEGDVARW